MLLVYPQGSECCFGITDVALFPKSLNSCNELESSIIDTLTFSKKYQLDQLAF